MTNTQNQNKMQNKEEKKEKESVTPTKDQEKIKELEAQVAEFKDKYLRALADYQNNEKRMMEERRRIMQEAPLEVFIQLLPVFDMISKAEIFVKDPGLQMVTNQLQSITKDMGLEEIEVLGKEFNPYESEAIEIIPSDKDNIVIEVLSKGYKFADRVVRPAKVKVGKKVVQS